jgi:serine/threonine protein kinase
VVEEPTGPCVKLIDFGVADNLFAEQAGASPSRQILGTPGYMSPEQAGLVTDRVDTRTDIYALGVLLFRLTTGALPFNFQEKSLLETYRIPQNRAPKPSTVLEERGQTAAAGLMRGSLDAIVLQAQQRQLSRRYGSVNELVRDLDNHLG